MSTFYGQVKGNAVSYGTRTGTAKSGIKSTVQSWQGSIITSMYYDAAGQLRVSVEVSQTSNCWGTPIFDGTMEEYIDKFRIK